MAIENAKKFLEQVSADQALRERVTEKDAATVMAVAKELGYDVTPEELTAAAKEIRKTLGDEPVELGRDDLEDVSGGVTHPLDGVIMLFSWIACGFSHDYKYTGKTKNRTDVFRRFTVYERICKECGHVDWTSTAP